MRFQESCPITPMKLRGPRKRTSAAQLRWEQRSRTRSRAFGPAISTRSAPLSGPARRTSAFLLAETLKRRRRARYRDSRGDLAAEAALRGQ